MKFNVSFHELRTMQLWWRASAVSISLLDENMRKTKSHMHSPQGLHQALRAAWSPCMACWRTGEALEGE
ncbi:hypothetical protein QQP08_007303 [Theobroma cacao]|nr:hypothetical protein QQP08_007303 [Theobroma cacao]